MDLTEAEDIKKRWQESLRRNGVTLMVIKESEMQYLDAVSKTTEWSLFTSKANHSMSQ